MKGPPNNSENGPKNGGTKCSMLRAAPNWGAALEKLCRIRARLCFSHVPTREKKLHPCADENVVKTDRMLDVRVCPCPVLELSTWRNIGTNPTFYPNGHTSPGEYLTALTKQLDTQPPHHHPTFSPSTLPLLSRCTGSSAFAEWRTPWRPSVSPASA